MLNVEESILKLLERLIQTYGSRILHSIIVVWILNRIFHYTLSLPTGFVSVVEIVILAFGLYLISLFVIRFIVRTLKVTLYESYKNNDPWGLNGERQVALDRIESILATIAAWVMLVYIHNQQVLTILAIPGLVYFLYIIIRIESTHAFEGREEDD